MTELGSLMHDLLKYGENLYGVDEEFRKRFDTTYLDNMIATKIIKDMQDWIDVYAYSYIRAIKKSKEFDDCGFTIVRCTDRLTEYRFKDVEYYRGYSNQTWHAIHKKGVIENMPSVQFGSDGKAVDVPFLAYKCFMHEKVSPCMTQDEYTKSMDLVSQAVDDIIGDTGIHQSQLDRVTEYRLLYAMKYYGRQGKTVLRIEPDREKLIKEIEIGGIIYDVEKLRAYGMRVMECIGYPDLYYGMYERTKQTLDYSFFLFIPAHKIIITYRGGDNRLLCVQKVSVVNPKAKYTLTDLDKSHMEFGNLLSDFISTDKVVHVTELDAYFRRYFDTELLDKLMKYDNLSIWDICQKYVLCYVMEMMKESTLVSKRGKKSLNWAFSTWSVNHKMVYKSKIDWRCRTYETDDGKTVYCFIPDREYSHAVEVDSDAKLVGEEAGFRRRYCDEVIFLQTNKYLGVSDDLSLQDMVEMYYKDTTYDDNLDFAIRSYFFQYLHNRYGRSVPNRKCIAYAVYITRHTNIRVGFPEKFDKPMNTIELEGVTYDSAYHNYVDRGIVKIRDSIYLINLRTKSCTTYTMVFFLERGLVVKLGYDWKIIVEKIKRRS